MDGRTGEPAANRGPRASTKSLRVVGFGTEFDMDMLLLMYGWAGSASATLLAGATRTNARLISSYNNSNNPQGGTDRLRGAW